VPYLSDPLLSLFAERHSRRGRSVLSVLSRGGKTQIGDPVVAFVTVDVIDVHPLRDRSIHMFPHQSVNVLKLLAESDPPVSSRRRCAHVAGDFVDPTGLWVNDQFGPHKFLLKCLTSVDHPCNNRNKCTKFLAMNTKTRSSYLSVRVTDKTHQKFHVKASKLGSPSEVLRELIDAFIEDRVTLRPPVNRNPLEKLYEP